MSPLGRPVQIAYAVDPSGDLERIADEFRDATGAGPFVVVRNIPLASCSISGRPGAFDHSSAYGWWGELMVELVQEHTPPLIDRISGLHHVAFMVPDLEQAIDWCRRRDWPTLLDAATGVGQRFVFADARGSLGHLVEMYEPSERLLGFYDHVRQLANA
ncbi:MAG: hypothetical protein RL413_1100 [Actinomycetota bacterium]